MTPCPACKSDSLMSNGLCIKCGHNAAGDSVCQRCGGPMNTGVTGTCGRPECRGDLCPITPGLNALQAIDDLDTRKEVCVLLEKLSDAERARFILWCVDICRRGGSIDVVMDQPPRDSFACFLDICILVMQYGLDPKVVLVKLEQVARRKPL